MKKIDHIGIAVKDFSESSGLFYKLLGEEPYKTEIVESENVATSFFRIGEAKIELLEALDQNSPGKKRGRNSSYSICGNGYFS